jgi:hypothetical protein
VTSRWKGSRNRRGRTSPLDPEQDQHARRRPASRVKDKRDSGYLIDHPTLRSVQGASGTLVLVTGVVMAGVTCPDLFRLAVRVPRCRVSPAMRSSTDGTRALGDFSDREGENSEEGEGKAERPPTINPPPTSHAATL